MIKDSTKKITGASLPTVGSSPGIKQKRAVESGAIPLLELCPIRSIRLDALRHIDTKRGQDGQHQHIDGGQNFGRHGRKKILDEDIHQGDERGPHRARFQELEKPIRHNDLHCYCGITDRLTGSARFRVYIK